MAICFSLDGKQLASSSLDNTIRIWDSTTGATLHALEVGIKFKMLSYSSDGSIMTDRGRLDAISLYNDSTISSSHSPVLSRPVDFRPNVWVHDEWIVCGEQRMLWLPPDCRHRCRAVHENIVSLGHNSGRVSIFEFLFE
jgi:WD40 repeat protein